MQDEEVVRKIKKIVKETDNSAPVILYGFRARGKAGVDSDWDILILLNAPHILP
ncbi:MAG: nucleotidyltransferase domain-containing protein [Flavisolibacter sp.]|nr:nucleotidyltransferase domain-containing protein [Flavisolibacter sp.]